GEGVSAAAAAAVLFEATGRPGGEACDAGDDRARIACLLRLRFATDTKAAAAAVALYAAAGWVAGVERAHVMEGGWRGKVTIVPEPPALKYRRHLDWVAAAAADFGAFFSALAPRAPRPPTYRWRDLAFRFFRSVGKATPSAYAADWTVAYNVSGSLLRSAAGVRATLFHEIFHLNDQSHGGWSAAALGPTYDALAARCRVGKAAPAKVNACLKPYAPHATKIIGSVYYAFHPESGVTEYAAELAVRYFDEQRAVLAGAPPAGRPFKCGPPENAHAWRRLVDEFFGGADLVPAC
ncbi:MAG TPA: hypothetical protein VG389_05840, partial [Myxococcota bacterium]|nr:hypothetical protein [Myxococcota bacterium]